MSNRAREQQALDSITEELTRSEPRLAALLATFTRLVSGEEMPVHEKIREGSSYAAARHRRRPAGKSHRRAVSTDQYAGFRRAALLTSLLITGVLIVICVVLSRGGGHSECRSLWAVACPSPAPARGTRHAEHPQPASQARDQQVQAWHTYERGSPG
jgi:hypothetical protein